ncbi:hypothetical protein THIOM_002234 [Candidatus Thiomargarita nelsonii]|uniref:Uncharacterized protein n=1 Tax=Candidatus Thiomargarita nelsonii TaxID=1003181 RepID=A0A176S1R1_9GAMM|nr:hypothetical protein THIOM_002234 [Candidatus Thiomargarita nelsonii]
MKCNDRCLDKQFQYPDNRILAQKGDVQNPFLYLWPQDRYVYKRDWIILEKWSLQYLSRYPFRMR